MKINRIDKKSTPREKANTDIKYVVVDETNKVKIVLHAERPYDKRSLLYNFDNLAERNQQIVIFKINGKCAG